jgi:cytochrome P450
MATATLARPPGPKPGYFSGSAAAFRRDQLGFYETCAREYGDVVPVRLGPTRGVHLNHPDLIEEVLVTQSHRFVKPVQVRLMRPVGGNGLFLSEGEFWRRQRRLAQPAFHRARLNAYSEVMGRYAQQMLGTWRTGDVRDMHQEMKALTLRIAAKALFDADVEDLVAEVGAALATIAHELQSKTNSLSFLVPYSVPTPGHLRLRGAIRRLDAIVYRIIDRRRASGEDPGDLLSTLLRAQDDDGSRMTDQQVRDDVMTLFIAGHETAALALTWALHLLGRHPEAAARVAAEADDVLGGRAAGAADVPRLTFTERVVKEALRLYPPAWMMGREAVDDCTIGGYAVPRGTVVLMSQWVLHRDPRFYEDPEAFHPERWTDDFERHLPRFAYFPFGGGQRVCIGGAFAMMEAVLVLATIAQQFRLTPVPGHVVEPVPEITLRPKYGVQMLLRRREVAAS